jgi:hypothetical protein
MISMESAVRVSARGYKRDSGARTIFEEEIVDAVIEEDGNIGHAPNTLYLKKSKSDGSITISIAPRTLSGFGGEYHLHVHLTEDEIVKLFLECFPQMRDVTIRVSQLPLRPDPNQIEL